MSDIRPNYKDNIAAQLRSVYFATIHRGIGAAWVIFLLCAAFEIPAHFMRSDHIQEIMQELKMKG